MAKNNNLPVIPGKRNKKNPTMLGFLIGDSFRAVNRKVKAVKRRVTDIVSNLPVRANNANDTTYTYDVSTTQLAAIYRQFDMVLRGQYLSGLSEFSDSYWFQDYIRESYERAAEESIKSAKYMTTSQVAGQTLADAIAVIPETNLLSSPGRARRVALIGSRVFENMKGEVVEKGRAELASVLANGIQNGQGISEITDNLMRRVDVSGSRAQRIARTEIGQSYRSSKRAETDSLNDEIYVDSEFSLKMLWFSALSSTTRKTHGRRHGRVYDVSEVQSFYSRDANEINCMCSQTQVLVDDATGEVMQAALVDRMAEERVEYFEDDQDAQDSNDDSNTSDSLPNNHYSRKMKSIGVDDAVIDQDSASNIDTVFGGGEYDGALKKLKGKGFNLSSISVDSNGNSDGSPYNSADGIYMGGHSDLSKRGNSLIYAHEFGHALDSALGSKVGDIDGAGIISPLSSSDKYWDAIDSDRKNIKKLSYGYNRKTIRAKVSRNRRKRLLDIDSMGIDSYAKENLHHDAYYIFNEVVGIYSDPKVNGSIIDSDVNDLLLSMIESGDGKKGDRKLILSLAAMADSRAYMSILQKGLTDLISFHGMFDLMEATSDYSIGAGHGKVYADNFERIAKLMKPLIEGSSVRDMKDARNLEAFAEIFMSKHSYFDSRVASVMRKIAPKQYKFIDGVFDE